jgi:hypothetical protein
MNALVPTGTSAFNDPAAFVTTTPSVSIEEREIGEEVRRTDHILHAKSCHESDGIHHGVERVAFIGMKLGEASQYLPQWWMKGQWSYTPEHRYDRHIPDLSKRELATMSWDYSTYTHVGMIRLLPSRGLITADAGGRRTSALPKAFQCTVWHDDPLCDTFRERSKPGTAHDANPRATEVRRKELCELYDVLGGERASIRWHKSLKTMYVT